MAQQQRDVNFFIYNSGDHSVPIGTGTLSVSATMKVKGFRKLLVETDHEYKSLIPATVSTFASLICRVISEDMAVLKRPLADGEDVPDLVAVVLPPTAPKKDSKHPLLDGLPQMAERGNGSDATASVPSETKHAKATSQAFKFGTIEPAPTLEMRHNSVIWAELGGEKSLSFSTEASVAHYIMEVMTDIRRLLPEEICASLSIETELQSHQQQPDILALVRLGRPVGFVEVKKPGNLMQPTILGEVFDYLMHLRCYDGLDQSYSILTSYHQWYICCLPDTQSHAEAKHLNAPPLKEMPTEKEQGYLPAIPPTSLECKDENAMGVSERARIATGDIIQRTLLVDGPYAWDDKDLVTILAHVLVKMVHSASTRLTCIATRARFFTRVEEAAWSWCALPSAMTSISFQPGKIPKSNAQRFTLLIKLGAGVSGVAFLATSSSDTGAGIGCVIKFRLPSSSQITFDEEAALWNEIWGDGKKITRALKLSEHHALIMPYYRTCDKAPPTEEVKVAARDAVNEMASKGYQHMDLHWRHVGLYKDDNDVLRAVLIDLGDVKKVANKEDKAEARASMLEALKLSTAPLPSLGASPASQGDPRTSSKALVAKFEYSVEQMSQLSLDPPRISRSQGTTPQDSKICCKLCTEEYPSSTSAGVLRVHVKQHHKNKNGMDCFGMIL